VRAWYSLTGDWKGAGTMGGCASDKTNGQLIFFGSGSMGHVLANGDSIFGDWTNNPNGSQKFTGMREAGAAAGGGGSTENSAKIGTISGEAVVRRNGAWVPLTSADQLKQGDEIFTGVDSRVVLKFADGSSLEIRELTQLLVQTTLVAANRKDLEVQLKLGEIKAQVKQEKAVDTTFEIRTATATASVRGTIFTVFYDPGAKATVVSTQRGIVSVDPVKPGLPTVSVTAGHELEVTAAASSALTAIGKAGARGGVNRAAAFRLVSRVVDRSAKPCGAASVRDAGAFAVKPAGSGWAVSIKLAGKVAGLSQWTVKGAKVAPANALATKLATGCR
jgi:hypothetical protein